MPRAQHLVVASTVVVALGLAAGAWRVSGTPRQQRDPQDQRGTGSRAPIAAAVSRTPAIDYDRQIDEYATRMLKEGRQTFRFDTFGSEDFWGGKLRLHEALAGEKLGGVGKGISPKAALELGLKVDAEAIPADLAAQIKAGKVDLNDPATTAALLKLNAVDCDPSASNARYVTRRWMTHSPLESASVWTAGGTVI
jgi:hypothetical protein